MGLATGSTFLLHLPYMHYSATFRMGTLSYRTEEIYLLCICGATVVKPGTPEDLSKGWAVLGLVGMNDCAKRWSAAPNLFVSLAPSRSRVYYKPQCLYHCNARFWSSEGTQSE